MRRLFRLSGWVAACALVATSGVVAVAGARAQVVARAALPSTRLEFGLSNLDSTWMTSSGVPWRYRFQYLAGGVNTSNNWLTWQDPAQPPGQFALDYMTGSTTSPAAYIPVFSWYQLLQSTPSVGGSELDRDYSNLNNAATMSSYYASFKLLMQKAGQYGGQVVVHVEPDFWGYMQQKAAGAGAGAISAMVKSSGFSEAAAFPDNLVGFAAELKYLRDTYAPNALLAMHASMWSSGIDIASDTRASIDPVSEADKTAAFLNSAGAGAWDALFNDVDDHNAAWWELASCGAPPCVNQYFTHWWDPNNVAFPNFKRYLAWVAELYAKTALPQLTWQVPMGNQFFLTMNNTCGHYQDNVAPYFIAHAADLFNAGLIAVLFGPGNSCQTSYDDSRKDGVTNNNGSPTSDQLGGCNACNTNVSTYSDDDGGYLRIFVGKYYAAQLPCATAAESATPLSPAPVGSHVVVTASSTGCANALYEFWILAPGAVLYNLVQAYSPNNTLSWSTNALAVGTYRINVWVRAANSSGLYGNPWGRWDTYNANLYFTVAPGCSEVTQSAAPSGAAMAGMAVTVTAAAAACLDSNPLYEFWVLAPGASLYTLAQSYSTSSVLTWNTSGLALGTYRINVWVRDGAGAFDNVWGTWDAYNASLYYTLTAGCPSVGVSAAAASASSVNITASAPGCSQPHYEVWILYPGASLYTLVQPYGAGGTIAWNTAGLPKGTYRIDVWVREASSPGAYGNAWGTWDAYNASVFYTLS